MRPYLFLIPLLPLLGFLFNFTVGVRVLNRKAGGHGHDDHGGHGAHHAPSPLIGIVAAGTVFLSFLLAIGVVLEAHGAPEHAIVQTLWTWLPGGAAETAVHGASGATPFTVEWAYLVDPLSSVMVLFVTFVGFLIHVYSIGYMGHDPGYARYMSYLNLFMFAMLTLVLGANYAVLFVGWEGVGLCSYLLIGFWFHKQSAVGRRARRRSSSTASATSASWLGDVPHLRARSAPSTSERSMAAAAELPIDSAWGGTLTPDRPSSSSWAPPARARSSRSSSGCPTPWRARRRSPPSSTPRRW